MPGLFIIAHAPLASALKLAAGHCFPELVQHLQALDVPPNLPCDELEAQARVLLSLAQDTDPRGLPVIGADGEQAGTVRDLWVDKSEMMFRYIEVDLKSGGSVLLPVNFSRIRKDGISVHAILAEQFAAVPKTRNPEQITLLEEEKIMAYYGAGTLYATPQRQEPLL